MSGSFLGEKKTEKTSVINFDQTCKHKHTRKKVNGWKRWSLDAERKVIFQLEKSIKNWCTMHQTSWSENDESNWNRWNYYYYMHHCVFVCALLLCVSSFASLICYNLKTIFWGTEIIMCVEGIMEEKEKQTTLIFPHVLICVRAYLVCMGSSAFCFDSRKTI